WRGAFSSCGVIESPPNLLKRLFFTPPSRPVFVWVFLCFCVCACVCVGVCVCVCGCQDVSLTQTVIAARCNWFSLCFHCLLMEYNSMAYDCVCVFVWLHVFE